MKTRIRKTKFGHINIDGNKYKHDVIIRLNGKIKKRKKKLSKARYGTSHIVSLAEAKHIYDKGAEQLIVGSGQFGSLRLSEDAENYFKQKGCEVRVFPTYQAIRKWNKAKGDIIGLFHVTC
jgi:hypothetical protein